VKSDPPFGVSKRLFDGSFRIVAQFHPYLVTRSPVIFVGNADKDLGTGLMDRGALRRA
jgi:hypothetical protein